MDRVRSKNVLRQNRSDVGPEKSKTGIDLHFVTPELTRHTDGQLLTGCMWWAGPVLDVLTPEYDEIGRCSICQNVRLFIRRKTGIMNVVVFQYSLHTF